MAGMAVLTVADTIARSFLLAVDKRGDKPAIREKKFGIWQPTSWRQWLQISKDIALRAACQRLPARRCRLDPRQCRARMGLCRHGHSLRRRRFLRHLSDRLRRPGRVPHQRLPHPHRVRRGRGAARQAARPAARAARRWRRSWCSTWRASPASPIRWCCRSPNSSRSARTTRQGREELWDEMVGSRTSERSCRPRLHLGHHGPTQGRDAFQPQRHAPDAACQRSLPVDRQRGAAGVPAALPRRRAGRRLLQSRWRWAR